MLFKKKTTVQDIINKSTLERDAFLKNFHEYVDKFDNIVLFQHIRPDGDCVGCVLGLKEILKQQFPHKKVYATGSDCGIFPWLQMEFDVLPNNFDFTKALAVVMDVGTSERIQEFNEYFKAPDKKFAAVAKIDHHGCESDFTVDLAWDDPTYVASACQLLLIAEYYGWQITPKAATYLYLGITTDSGSFVYDSALPRSLIIGAKVLRKGADKSFLNQNLQRRTWTDIKAAQHILNNVKKEEHLLWYHMTNEDRKKLNLGKNQTQFVNVLANIEDNKLWVIFYDTDTEAINCEVRSLGLSVRELAISFGGGGHENAAGCTLSSAKQIPVFIEKASALVREYVTQELLSVNVDATRFNDDQLYGSMSFSKEEIAKGKAIKDAVKDTLVDVKATSQKIIEDMDQDAIIKKEKN